MFGTLFDEEGDTSAHTMTTVHNFNVCVPRPPMPRPPGGLCGIMNQGATCYLNSLLQTLLFTPEFREGLFRLTESELGRLADKERGGKVRVIPLQLQKLFARLLLVDQEAASTTDLTDSFGWKNNEELQEHDVQELNRILFCAIERSLTGTSGCDLISKLYHGSTYSEIICQVCGKISERVEEFMDLYVTVANFNSLQDSLSATYLQKEIMKGTNQYRCSTCYKLVDAERGLKIRCLPPILTFSLSRFSYDIAKRERIKETGKFTFPMELDMSLYCDKEVSTEDSTYELFSVLVHSGTSHGGHYLAYIRDIDCLGKWFAPDEEPLVVPASETSSASVVQGPVSLVKTLLSQQADHCLSVDKLCQEILKFTGFSWGKRFKNSHGSINKFLLKHSDMFYFNTATNIAYLKEAAIKENLVDEAMSVDGSPSNSGESAPNSPREVKKGHTKNSLKLNLFDKKKAMLSDSLLYQYWFHFNDSKVHPVLVNEIEKQYSGKESAYMLFYRRKSLHRPEEAKGNPRFMMPQWLLDMVQQENKDLKRQRELHDMTTNTINLSIHFAENYLYQHGALRRKEGRINPIELAIDRRKTLSEARRKVSDLWTAQLFPSNEQPSLTLYIAKKLIAGFHLYEDLKHSQDDSSLTDLRILEGTNIFACPGAKIGGEPLTVGADSEPVWVHISTVLRSGEPLKVSTGIPKSATFLELKSIISAYLSMDEDDISISREENIGNEIKKVLITESQVSCNLVDLSLKDNDSLIIESIAQLQMEEACDKPFILIVQDRTSVYKDEEISKFPFIEINVKQETVIQELKAVALSKFGLGNLKTYRLRKFTEDRKESPPLHEHQTVQSAGLLEAKYLMLEEGIAPAEGEMTILFNTSDCNYINGDCCLELNIPRKHSVQQCVKDMLRAVGLSGDNWKLQKTNMFGDAEMLFWETTTLEEEGIQHGDYLLLASSYVPPKGFMNFQIWLYPTQENLSCSNLPHINGVIMQYANLFKTLSTLAKSKCGLLEVGDIEISGDSTVYDLKKSILTLPVLSVVQLPNINYLRVRMLEGSRPNKVIRGLTNTLKKLRLQSHQSLCMQLLAHEENLTQDNVLLNIRIRNPSDKTYSPSAELTWDTSESASLKVLKQELSNRCHVPVENLILAKHHYDKFEWQIIEDNLNPKKKNSRWASKKSSNLRYAPYYLKDGDTIGIKDRRMDPFDVDDFATAEDIEGQEILRRREEERMIIESNEEKRIIDGKRQRLILVKYLQLGLEIPVPSDRENFYAHRFRNFLEVFLKRKQRSIADCCWRQTRSSGFYEEWTFDSGDSDVERCIKKPEKGIIIHVDDFR